MIGALNCIVSDNGSSSGSSSGGSSSGSSGGGGEWNDERLFRALDLGGYDGSDDDDTNSSGGGSSSGSIYTHGNGSRVWVLDPIDGTKGFMRGRCSVVLC